jgi:hypothetical protein
VRYTCVPGVVKAVVSAILFQSTTAFVANYTCRRSQAIDHFNVERSFLKRGSSRKIS